MRAALLINGAAWALLMVFLSSALRKVPEITSGAARWHPIFVARPWLRAHAQGLMALSLVLDVGVVAGLFLRPKIGASLAVSALVVYTVASFQRQQRLHNCNCFWGFLNARTSAGLFGRNFVMLLLAAVVLLGKPQLSRSGAILGVAIFALLIIVTQAMDRRIAKNMARERGPDATVPRARAVMSVETKEGGYG